MTRRGLQRLLLFLALLAVSAVAGPIYVWLARDDHAAFYRSGVFGLLGGVLLWGSLLYVWPARFLAPLRRQSFPVRVLVLCSFAALVTVTVGCFAVYLNTGIVDVSQGTYGGSLILYVLGVSMVLLVILQIVRMIGTRSIANVLLGRYHNPVEEERVFLFVDLADSTALARKLGDLGVQKLISRFVFDITAPIVEHGGEIHAYVGDQVIVTWPIAKGIRDATCVSCFFAIQDCLEERTATYEQSFGTVPRVRAGLHGGPVVVSEIGDVKTAIVYSGDTVNTTARLEGAASRHDSDLVVSGALIDRMTVPGTYQTRELGTETLRGRDQETALFSITRS